MRTVRDLIGLVLALVAGLVLLTALAGPPGIGDVAASGRALRESASGGRVPVEALVGLLGPALWLLWGYLALSTALKALTSFLVGLTQGTLAGARAAGRAVLFLDRLVERVSVPLVRNSTRMMVTAGMLAKLATSAPEASAVGAPPAAVATTHDPRSAGHRADEAEQDPNYTEVRRGEGLYQVAERVWGDGERWPEIWEANKGRVMPGGVRFNGSLKEGWALEVPGGKLLVQEREGASPRRYSVEAGDSLRGIAERHLGDETRWREIYELNRDVIGGNPDLIRIGQKLELPARGKEGRAGRTVKPPTRQARQEVERPSAPRHHAGEGQKPTRQERPQPVRGEGAAAGASPGSSGTIRPTREPDPRPGEDSVRRGTPTPQNPAAWVDATPTAGVVPGAVAPTPTQPRRRVNLPAPRPPAGEQHQAPTLGARPAGHETPVTPAEQAREPEKPELPPALLPLAAAGLLAAGAVGALGRRYRRSTQEPPVPRERRLSPPEEVNTGFEEGEEPAPGGDSALVPLVAQGLLARVNEGVPDGDEARLLTVQAGAETGNITLRLEAPVTELERVRDVAYTLADELGGIAGVHSAPDQVLDVRLLGVGRPAEPIEGAPPQFLLPLGVVPGGETLLLNWPEVGRTLVAGAPGMGVPEVLTSLVARLADAREPGALKLLTIASCGPGGLPAQLLALPHQAGEPVDPADASGVEQLIGELSDELGDRLRASRMGGLGVARPEILLVASEVGALARYASVLSTICTHGERVRIRMLMGTEQPSELPDGLLAYFPTRLVAPTGDREESIRLLGTFDAASPAPPGTLYARVQGRHHVRVGAYRLTERWLDELTRRYSGVPEPVPLPLPEERRRPESPVARSGASPEPEPQREAADRAVEEPTSSEPARLTDLPLAPPPETKAVHVRVFGQGSVLLRGGDGSYRSVKLAAQQEELLFYLALQPGYSAPSDAAIESLGMADDADPRANLWQKASRARNELRKHMPELGAEQLIVLDRKRGVIRLEASCFSCDATHFNQLAATAAREGVLVEERVALLNTAASLWEGGMLRRAEKKGGQSMAWLDDNSRGLTIRQGYTDAYDKICDRLAADLMTLGRWEEALHVLLSRLREEPALGDLERAAIECCMHLGSRNRLRQLKRELYQLRAAMLADEERGNDWEAEPETLAAYERAEKLLAGVGARRRAEA